MENVPSSFRMVATDRVFAVWWTGSPTGSDVQRSVEMLERMAATAHDPTYMCVVAPEASMPDASGRRAFLENADRVMAACGDLRVVLSTNPFLNAFARGLVTTAGLLPRYRGRVHLHATVDEATLAIARGDAGRGEALLAKLVRPAF